MVILDTNHLDVLMVPGPNAERLAARLDAFGDPISTTIISVQEKASGWLAAINSKRTRETDLPALYAEFGLLIDFFRGWIILPFELPALQQFQTLRKLFPRDSTMDLRIASIALCHQALLLTRNTRHFSHIPNLRLDNWHPG